MSVTVIPITTAPPVVPLLAAGQLLSARERGAVQFREKVSRELNSSGPKRSADLILGFKHGWDAAIEHLRLQGAIR